MKTTNRPRINLYVRRSFAEKLSAIFDFTSENFRPLFRFLSVFLLPLCIIGGVCYTLLFGQMFGSLKTGYDTLAAIYQMVVNYSLTILVSIVAFAATSGVVYTLMQQYWARPTRLVGITYAEMKTSLWANIRKSLRLELALLAVFLLAIILIIAIAVGVAVVGGATLDSDLVETLLGLGLLMFYIVILVVALPLALACPACVLGHLTIWQSVKQAFRLGFRVWGGLLGIVIILYMICQLVSMALGIPFMVLSIIKGVTMQESSNDSFTSETWFNLANYVSGALFLYGTYMSIGLLQIGMGFYYGHAAEKVDGISMTQDVDQFEALTDEVHTGATTPADEMDDEITHFDKL